MNNACRGWFRLAVGVVFCVIPELAVLPPPSAALWAVDATSAGGTAVFWTGGTPGRFPWMLFGMLSVPVVRGWSSAWLPVSLLISFLIYGTGG